jgi:DNA mismatch repair protein MutS
MIAEAVPEPDNPILRMVAQVKAERGQDVLVLVKMLDFYEAFGCDAEVLAGEPCNLSLSSRKDQRSGQRFPMAGFPVHRLSDFTSKLIRAGFRVAVCEQGAEWVGSARIAHAREQVANKQPTLMEV